MVFVALWVGFVAGVVFGILTTRTPRRDVYSVRPKEVPKHGRRQVPLIEEDPMSL